MRSALICAAGLVMGFWLISSPARAVSFDCTKASNTAEFLICGNPVLSDLDDRMAAAYAAARSQYGNGGQLLASQRAWLARRNQCRDIGCLAQEYQARLADLGELPASPGNTAPASHVVEIPLQSQGGTLTVPVSINSRITLDFIIDSGAADVSIPADVVMTLVRTGSLSQSDFLGRQTYTLADGSTVPSETFRIRSLKVGNMVLENVTGSVAPVKGDLLLGQSFLSRFRSWSINNERRVLVLQ